MKTYIWDSKNLEKTPHWVREMIECGEIAQSNDITWDFMEEDFFGDGDTICLKTLDNGLEEFSVIKRKKYNEYRTRF